MGNTNKDGAASRVQKARKAHHGQFAEVGTAPNQGGDGPARSGNQPHTPLPDPHTSYTLRKSVPGSKKR